MARVGKRSETEQDRLVAAALYAGDSPPVACRRAGYAESTIKIRAHKICRSERVQARLREIARNIHANELTTLGRARIHQKLTSGEKNDKVMLGYIRTGAELEGQLGGPQELHLHQHSTLPPRVQAMLEEKMRDILAERQAAERGQSIDAELVTAPAETAAPPSARPEALIES